LPFVRFSRDKRGYEHTYLIEPPKSHSGGHARILYWFRTMPGIKVGREPFDDEARRTLESQYPDIRFDWERIVNTAPPPPDAQHWRERRLAEKAARKARATAAEGNDDGEGGNDGAETAAPDEVRPGQDLSAADEPAAAADKSPEKRRRRRRGRRGRTGVPAMAPPDLAGETAPQPLEADQNSAPVVSDGEDL
jgi:hypothetical protein